MLKRRAVAMNASTLRVKLHQLLQTINTSEQEIIVLVGERPIAVLSAYRDFSELKYEVARAKKSRLAKKKQR